MLECICSDVFGFVFCIGRAYKMHRVVPSECIVHMNRARGAYSQTWVDAWCYALSLRLCGDASRMAWWRLNSHNTQDTDFRAHVC